MCFLNSVTTFVTAGVVSRACAFALSPRAGHGAPLGEGAEYLLADRLVKMTVAPLPCPPPSPPGQGEVPLDSVEGGVRAVRTLGKEHPRKPWGRRVKVSV